MNKNIEAREIAIETDQAQTPASLIRFVEKNVYYPKGSMHDKFPYNEKWRKDTHADGFEEQI